MIEQFTYMATGRFSSGAAFETELLVVAASEAEAEDEAMICIDSFESITDWSLKPIVSTPADQNEVSRYQQQGPFAVFDPAVLHERG